MVVSVTHPFLALLEDRELLENYEQYQGEHRILRIRLDRARHDRDYAVRHGSELNNEDYRLGKLLQAMESELERRQLPH